MLKRITNLFQRLISTAVQHHIHTNRILGGRTLATINSSKSHSNIHGVEFKVFSQWGDDGIIQYLIHHLDIPNKTFIEFGVENYTEANTRFLLINNNWSGLIMDGSQKNMDQVRVDEIFWKYDLQVKDVFVTAENINELIASTNFNSEVGILHIDIDGNDFWVWKAINNIKPIIVIVEYNSVFGDDAPYTVPYNPSFYRTTAHYSNLYYGTSLLSLCDLAEEKGYHFIGCNSNGNNAYFIRKDKISIFKPLTCKEGYVKSKFKESRNETGNLTYLHDTNRIKSLKGMEVYNTQKQLLENL